MDDAKGGMGESLLEQFERLAVPHLEAVYRMARRLARDADEADDLTQETFVRACRAFERFELRDHGVKPWLLKILHNAFFTHRTKAGRRPALLGEVGLDQFSGREGDEGSNGDDGLGGFVEESVPGLENIDWDVIDEELKRAVESLQPEYREVLLLWSFEEMTYKEIAEVCDCAVGTVMSRLYRARQMLVEKLTEYAERHNVRRRV